MGDMVGMSEQVQAALLDLISQPAKAENTWSWPIGNRGRRIVVSRFRGAGYVNIRNYWAPLPGENAHPTKIGVNLTAAAFTKMIQYDVFVNDDVCTVLREFETQCRAEEELTRKLDERREAILARAAEADNMSQAVFAALQPLPRPATFPRLASLPQFLSPDNVLPPVPKKQKLNPRPTPVASKEEELIAGPSSAPDVDQLIPTYPSAAVTMDYLDTDTEGEVDEEEPLIVAVEGPLNPTNSSSGKGPRVKKTPMKK